jgi:hypothetical protein
MMHDLALLTAVYLDLACLAIIAFAQLPSQA